MLLHNHLKEPIVQPPTFIGGQVIDPFDVIAHGKQTLPPGDRVGAHYGVDGAEGSANVIWGPAGLCI
jgi:hypothetical protein